MLAVPQDRGDFRANPDYKGVCHVALAQEGHCKPGEKDTPGAYAHAHALWLCALWLCALWLYALWLCALWLCALWLCALWMLRHAHQ